MDNQSPSVLFDQYNLLERFRNDDSEVYQFLKNLLNIFRNYVIAASNNNDKLKILDNLIAQEIYLPANHIFANHDEALLYMNHLGYFSEALSRSDQVKSNLKKIEEFTRFNPLELMILQ